MADYILKSEVTEHISNRQTAKILYLQQELAQAQDQIKDLNYMLQLNKEALRLTLLEKQENNGAASPEFKRAGGSESAVNNYFVEENKRLIVKIEELTKERNLAQSRALINRQIAEESENRVREIELESEEKIHELRRIIQDKEFTIQELEKIKPTSTKDGVFIKYREILNPNEQLMKLQQENAVLLINLNKISKKTHELEERDKQISQTNSLLKKELIKIRTMLVSSVNFTKIRSYILEGNEAVSDDDEPIVPHETLYLSKKPSENNNKGEKEIDIKEKEVLKKQKPQSPLFQPHFPLKMENLEKENKHLKELTQKEFINSQLLLNEIKNLKNIHESLLCTNETLIKSNRALQEKVQRFSSSLEFYRVYFYEYMDFLRQGRKLPRSASLAPSKETKDQRRLRHDSANMKSHEFMPKEENKEVNVSILEEEKEKSKPKTLISQASKTRLPDNETDEHENVNYKTFLLNLAKELYTNPNIRSFYSINKDLLKKMEITNFRLNDYKYIIKPKRSLSNPLNYVSDSLKNKLEKPPLKAKKSRVSNNVKLRKMLSKGLSPMKIVNGPGDLKSSLLPLFNLDVSKIANENMELSFDAKGGEEGFFLV